MANNLTGDYEAVLQVSVRQINGLLATLHQNGATKDISPSFMHSEIFRVGDAPAAFSPDIKSFDKWLVSDQDVFHLSPAAGGGWTTDFGKALPGVVALLEESFVKWNDTLTAIARADSVSGKAHIQFSTPSITFEQLTSQVIASVYIRAHYFAVPGTQLMPKPVHGRVQVMYALHLDSQTKELNIPVPADDSAIQFFPERQDPSNPASPSTLTPAQDEEITAQIRKVLRKSIKPMKVPLPADFQFFEFKALDTSADQTIALPVRLSGASPPTGGLQSVTNHFRGASDDFAIGVSKEFVATQFQPTLNNLRLFTRSFEIPIEGWSDPTYHFSVTGANIQFQADFIDLIVNGRATTNAWFFSNYDNIVITQRMTLVLIGQDVSLQASDNDITISGLHSAAVGGAKAAIIAERNKELPKANNALNAGFAKARTQLNNGLQQFDNSAAANYISIEIKPDGIIVRGAIGTKWHYAPVVDFEEVNDFGFESREGSGNAITARRSWIPGGRITNYLWTWGEEHVGVTDSGQRYSIPGFGKVGTSGNQPHHFILPKPKLLADQPMWSVRNRLCLEITGTQTSADGIERPIVAGRTCKVSSFKWLPVQPAGIPNPLVKIWYPPVEFSPDAPLDESIFAHIDAGADVPSTGGFSGNYLFHFADWRADQPLAGLNHALGQLRADASLAVAVVLPVGSLHATRGDVEAKLGLLAGQREAAAAPQAREDRTPIPFEVTEDYEGSWTQVFGVREAPATFLINARGEFVWKHDGAVDAERLAAALHEHLVPGPPPRAHVIALSVRPGELVPDVSFADDRGQPISLRRLRGRKVLVNFFLSWTKPCISELRRLQGLHERAGNDGPFIVALCADEDPQTLAEVRDQHHLTFPLAHDADRRVSRLFHVGCWPTTVSINPDGIVDHIQFGMAPDRSPRIAAKAT